MQDDSGAIVKRRLICSCPSSLLLCRTVVRKLHHICPSLKGTMLLRKCCFNSVISNVVHVARSMSIYARHLNRG